MNTIFTVVKYNEKIEGKTVKSTVFENKNFTVEKIFDVAKKNNYQVIVITRDIIVVKTTASFYEYGHKKELIWTFFTTEEWRESLREELEYK